jgi:hypothetical protein
MRGEIEEGVRGERRITRANRDGDNHREKEEMKREREVRDIPPFSPSFLSSPSVLSLL